MRFAMLTLASALGACTYGSLPTSSAGPYVDDVGFAGDHLVADTCYLIRGGHKEWWIDPSPLLQQGLPRLRTARVVTTSTACWSGTIRIQLPRGIAPPGWMPTVCRRPISSWQRALAERRAADRWRAHQACLAERTAIASRFRDPENRAERLRLSIGMPTCRPAPPRVDTAPSAAEVEQLWSAVPTACRRYTRP